MEKAMEMPNLLGGPWPDKKHKCELMEIKSQYCNKQVGKTGRIDDNNFIIQASILLLRQWYNNCLIKYFSAI